MSSPRSPYGRALSHLVDRLADIRSRDVGPTLRVLPILRELVSTPGVWPIDDVLYEMILVSGGLDLRDAEHLQAAIQLTGFLREGDDPLGTVCCGHGDNRSDLCSIAENWDYSRERWTVNELRHRGYFDDLLQLRRQRSIAFGFQEPETPESFDEIA